MWEFGLRHPSTRLFDRGELKSCGCLSIHFMATRRINLYLCVGRVFLGRRTAIGLLSADRNFCSQRRPVLTRAHLSVGLVLWRPIHRKDGRTAGGFFLQELVRFFQQWQPGNTLCDICWAGERGLQLPFSVDVVLEERTCFVVWITTTALSVETAPVNLMLPRCCCSCMSIAIMSSLAPHS